MSPFDNSLLKKCNIYNLFIFQTNKNMIFKDQYTGEYKCKTHKQK